MIQNLYVKVKEEKLQECKEQVHFKMILLSFFHLTLTLTFLINNLYCILCILGSVKCKLNIITKGMQAVGYNNVKSTSD